MNQRFDPNENRSVNPAAWPADQASQRIDPVTGAPVNDPLASQRRPEDIEPRASRSKWPLLIILLAGLVLAMLVWLPAEMSNDPANDAATPPATTEQSTTPPVDNATPPVDNSATPGTVTPETNATPDTTTTPNATPAVPDTQTPATGTDQQTPATGTAPQN